jgi:hypothetical protein
MDENLVGYLLKALDPDEQQAVEAHLEAHPEARAKLDLLERGLAPLAADADNPEPRPGLALSALARIAEHKCRPLPAAPRPPRSQVVPTGWARMRRADVLAAAALLVIVGGLTLPGLLWARQQVDRTTCQNNMRTIWAALQQYSEQEQQAPKRSFPMVREQGPLAVAGAFMPMLHDAGTLNNVTLVACPSRPPRDIPVGFSRSDLEAAFDRNEEEFAQLARGLTGGYAYTIGYRNGPDLVGLTANDPGTLPILADLPGGNGNSLNHGGSGQNVLYIGGNVQWCVNRNVGEAGDDIYVNKHNFLRAGEGRSDTVLAPGDAGPAGSK